MKFIDNDNGGVKYSNNDGGLAISSPFSIQSEDVGNVCSLWAYLKPRFEEEIQHCKEIVILDPRYTDAYELIKSLKELGDNNANLVLVYINDDQSINAVKLIYIKPEIEDQLDFMSRKHNGILRIIS